MDRPHRVNVSLTLWLCLAVAVSFSFLFILSNWAVEPFSAAERASVNNTLSQKAGLDSKSIKHNAENANNTSMLNAKSSRSVEAGKIMAPIAVDGPIPAQTRRDLVNLAKDDDDSQANEAIKQAAMLVDSGQWQMAEGVLTELLAREPKNEIALVEMALLQLIEKKDPGAARGYLERAVAVDPTNTSTINELLSVYSETGQLDDGLSFLKSIPQDKNNGTVDYAIANALQMSGRVEESVSYYEKALESPFQRDHLAKEELADAYVELGRFDEAIGVLEALVAQNAEPRKAKGLKIRLAHAYMEKGQPEEAMRVLGELKEQNPEDPLISQLMSDIQKQYM